MKLRLPKFLKAALLACFTVSLALTMGSASAALHTSDAAAGTWSDGTNDWMNNETWASGDELSLTSTTGCTLTLGSNIVASKTTLAGGDNKHWTFDLAGHTLDFGDLVRGGGSATTAKLIINGGHAIMKSFSTGGGNQSGIEIGEGASLTLGTYGNAAWLHKFGKGSMIVTGVTNFRSAGTQLKVFEGALTLGTVTNIYTIEISGGSTLTLGTTTGSGDGTTIVGGSTLVLTGDFGAAATNRSISFNDNNAANTLKLDSATGLTLYGGMTTANGNKGQLINVKGNNKITGNFQVGETIGNPGVIDVQGGSLAIEGEILATAGHGLNLTIAENASLTVGNVSSTGFKFAYLHKKGAGTMTLTGLFAHGVWAASEHVQVQGGKMILSGAGAFAAGMNLKIFSGAELLVQNTLALESTVNEGTIRVGTGGELTLKTGATGGGKLIVDGGSLRVVGAAATTSFTGDLSVASASSLTVPAFIFDMGGLGAGIAALTVTGSFNWTDDAQFITLNWIDGTPIDGSYTLISAASGTGTFAKSEKIGAKLFVYDFTGGTLTLTVKNALDFLTWQGGSGTWTIGATGTDQWDNGAEGYQDGLDVHFNGAIASTTVTIDAGGVSPLSMSISSGVNGSYTFDGGAIKSGTLTVSAGGVTLLNANTSAGLATIDAGTSLTLGGAAGTWAGAIVNNGSLVFDHTADFTFTPNITGSGELIKKGANILKLLLAPLVDPAIATFSGGTTVKLGVLEISHNGGSFSGGQSYSLGSGSITMEAGAQVLLDLNHASGAANSWTFVNDWKISDAGTIRFFSGGGNDILAGNIELAANAKLTFSFNHGVSSLADGIQLKGALTGAVDTAIILDNTQQSQWAGSRNLHLLADNSSFYGTIQVQNSNKSGYNHDLALLLDHQNAAVNACVDLQGFDATRISYLDLNVASATIGGLTGNAFAQVNTQFSGGSILTLNDLKDGVFAGKITGDNLSLIKAGSATWTVSGDSDYKGGTTIAAGVLKVGSLHALGLEGLISLTGAILDVAVENFARDITVSSGVTNILRGEKLSSYTGKITVGDGTLALGADLGSGIIDLTGTSSLDMLAYSSERTINTSGTNILSGTGFTGVLNVNAGTLSLGSALGASTTNAINLTGTGSLDMAAFDAARTINASGTNTLSGTGFTGVLNVNAGTLSLGSALGASTTNAINLTGTGSLDMAAFDAARTINASGTNTLSGTGFTGVLNVNAGTLSLGSALGASTTNVINLTGTGSLDMNSQAISRQLVVSGTSTLSGNANYSGNVTLANASHLTVTNLSLGNAQVLTLGADVNISSAQITGGLTLASNSRVAFDMVFGATGATTTTDSLTVTGNLSVTATEASKAFFDIDFNGALVLGDYGLMTYSNSLTEESLKSLGLNIARGRTIVSLDQRDAGSAGYEIFLKVESTDALRWSASSGTWQDVAGVDHVSGPWVLNSDPSSMSSDNNFHNTDAVIFGSDGSGDVTIVGEVKPSSMEVDGGAYVFTGAGSIVGAGKLSVSESLAVNKTSLSLTKANAGWTGQVDLSGGTLILSVQDAAGKGVITISGGKLELRASSAITNNTLKYNGGTLVFAGIAQSYNVSFTMDAGVTSVEVDVASGNSAKLNATGLASKHIAMTGSGALLMDIAAVHSGNVSLDGGSLLFTNTGGNFAITGNLTSGNAASILSFNASNTSAETRLTGNNTVASVNVDAHTLVLASATAMGGSILSLTNGATLKFEVNQTKNDFSLQLASTNNTLSTDTAAINFAGAITSTVAATTLHLSGNLTLSGAITLNRTGDQLAVLGSAKISLGNASGNQAVSALSAAGNSFVTLAGKLGMGNGGFTGAGSLVLGAGAELTATDGFTNALQTTLTADAVLNTGAFDVVFSSAVNSGVFSLTKKGTGTLTLRDAASNLKLVLSAGALDMANSAATLHLITAAAQEVSLANAGSLNAASTTSIEGSLHLDGNIGGRIDLKAGGSLDLTAGALTNTLNTGAGEVVFNKSALATWSNISLDKDSILTYKVDNAAAALLLGAGQSLSSGFGSQLKGSLVFSGGSLQMGNSGAPTAVGKHTLLTLTNGGSLTIMAGTNTLIDLSELSLGSRGEYVFTLVAGAGLSSLDPSLLTWKIDETRMNLLDTPSFSMAANGDLLLNISIAASLIWNGAVGNNVWTADETVKNWSQGAGGANVAFEDNDFVYFGDQGSGTIVLVDTVNVGTVKPKSMFVEGSQVHSFTGVGSIVATGKLLYSGTGDLIFANDGDNEFASGIELASTGTGKTILAGEASLKGNLKLSSNLEITSSAVSRLTKVNGAGDILINSTDGKGGASLISDRKGDYTGHVTIYQGSLTNKNALDTNQLSIAATGKVNLSGVAISSIQSLSTTQAGASIHGLTGSLALGNVSLKLAVENQRTSIINFTGGSGSLDMGSLDLDISSLVFLDYTKTYDFVITNGSFGDALLTVNAMGMYNNFTLSGANPNGLKVLGAKDGVISIGGSITYENFVLDVNNKWTPHITSNQAAVFTSAQFRTDPDNATSAEFKSVTVDGVLKLSGNDAFTLNHLTGGKTGQILTEGADLILNGTGDHPVTGATDNVFNGVLSAATSNVTIQGTQSLLGSNEMKTLTLDDNASLTLGAYTKIYGEEVGGVRVGVTLKEGSTLTMASNSLLEVAGSVTLATGSQIQGSGVLSILVGGGLTVLDGATIGGSIVVNLEHSSNGDGILNTGTTAVEIAGISGGGKVISNGSLTLNVSGKESFTGTLTGSGTAALPAATSGTIIKEGAGNQVLAATTDKNNLYNLIVKEGALTLNGKSADYGDIIVGADAPRTRAARIAVGPDTGHMVIESKITGKDLTVKHDGLLTIGSASGNASSLTLSGTASFDAGSELEFYVGASSTAMITAKTITGISNLDSLTINATAFWQANIDLVLFKAENGITDIFGADKVTLIGFDNKEIIYSDDSTTITLSAQRGFDNNPYKNAMIGAGQNANAGMDIIWDANVRGTVAPGSTLASVFDSMVFLGSGTEASNRLMAAVAGSTVTALAGSQRDDFRQQQDWIRNRTTTMGISPDYVHEDLPYVNGWIQANGGTTRVSDNGQEAGYDMNTFGGTFGFDVDMSAKLTWGFAFTANYNKLTVQGAETAKGNNDAYYANLFLRTQTKRWANTFIITGGWNDAKLDRTVSGSLVNYTAHGTTSGSTIGAMYETTYDIALNENKTSIFQPLFNLSISNASMDAYTEEGAGNAGLQVDKTKGTYGTIALGARLLGSVGQSLFGRTSMGELRLQVAQDVGDDTNVAKVGLGGMQREIIGTKVGKTALQLGAGINIPVNENGSIYIDVNGEFRSESTNVNANVGYRVNF